MALLELPLSNRSARWSASWTLDGVDVVLQFWWHVSLCGWFVDVFEADGTTAIIQGQRVSPGGGPYSVIPCTSSAASPPGTLFFDGPDPYRQEDLGRSVRLFYDEVQAQ